MSARANRKGRGRTGWRVTAAVCVCAATAATAVAAKQFGEWGAPVNAQQGSHPELNTAANDGCPILSPDGLSLYMASNRPGGMGNFNPATGVMDNQDIWVAHRKNTRSGWGAPVNLGAPVNSPVDDFCPTPVRGKRLFFVSRRDEPNGDIYVTRQRGDGWEQPLRLPFSADGTAINSPAQEWSPAYFRDRGGRETLYFGSTRVGGPGGQDIYFSVNYGPAQLAPGLLNTPFDDARPNVRRDGLEIVFDSNRPGFVGSVANPDLYSATRDSTDAPWPAAEHLAALSSPAGDTRASLSWDGSFLLFGSARPGGEGMADIYVTTRPRIRGRDRDD